MSTSGYTQNGKSVSEVLYEFKSELLEFLITRFQMLRSELKQKIDGWKVGLPALIIGLLMLVMTFVLFTVLLIAVIAMPFNGQPWGYALSFAIVTVIYGASGAAFTLFGWRKIKESGIVPERTIKVLKQDGIWIHSEARIEI
jgi:uncharacterized membrane protein YqjE